MTEHAQEPTPGSAAQADEMSSSLQVSTLELTFWRTLGRYLVSIVASLLFGFAWLITGARLLRLHMLGTIATGVLALALGFLVMGYLWLSLDLSRPAPAGVDERERSYQLFFLWLGIPLLALALLLVVGLLSVIVGAVVLGGGVPRP